VLDLASYANLWIVLACFSAVAKGAVPPVATTLSKDLIKLYNNNARWKKEDLDEHELT